MGPSHQGILGTRDVGKYCKNTPVFYPSGDEAHQKDVIDKPRSLLLFLQGTNPTLGTSLRTPSHPSSHTGVSCPNINLRVAFLACELGGHVHSSSVLKFVSSSYISLLSAGGNYYNVVQCWKIQDHLPPCWESPGQCSVT